MSRELAILTFQTLDGVMQAPRLPDEDRSGDFEHGGWAVPCWDSVMAQVASEAMAVPYDILFGRKTYELFAANFPAQGDAHPMNRARKYVVTSTLSELRWCNSVPLSGDVATVVSRLKREDGPLLQVHGSWQLIQGLLANNLIDEFRLWTFPVVVGTGKRVFGDGALPCKFELVKASSTSTGATMSFYRRAGTDS